MAIAAGLVAVGGIAGLIGIRNPGRQVDAGDCAGGQLSGAPLEAARHHPRELTRASR